MAEWIEALTAQACPPYFYTQSTQKGGWRRPAPQQAGTHKHFRDTNNDNSRAGKIS